MSFPVTACASRGFATALLLSLIWAFGGVAQASEESRQLQWRRAIDSDDTKTLDRLFDPSLLSVTNEKGKTALMTAAKLGDFELYRRLLDGGLDPRQRSRTGGTVLMYAVLGKRLDFVDHILLAQRPQINLQSSNGWTAAMIAAAKGYQGVLQRLMAAGADINIADAYRWSPLMRAIDNRHPQTATLLARAPGVRLDWQNENRATALHVAASIGDLASVRLLLSLGASASVRDSNGRLAIDIARAAGHAPIVELLQ